VKVVETLVVCNNDISALLSLAKLSVEARVKEIIRGVGGIDRSNSTGQRKLSK